MSKSDPFSARLDRMKAETDAQHGTAQPQRIVQTRPTGDGFGLRQMVLPVLSLSILAVGAFAFANVLTSDTNGPFDLESAIAMNMSDEDRANLSQDDQIKEELKKRNFADPSLVRATLSN